MNTEACIGKRKQTIENLQYYLGYLAQTGMNIGAVTPGEWAKAAQKLLQESGIRDPQSYVLDPELVKQQFFMQLQQQIALQEQQQVQQAGQAGLEAGKADGNAARAVQRAMMGGMTQ